jgi:hypothetical protein
VGNNILDLGDLCWVNVLAEACCNMIRLETGAEKSPDEESVVQDKHNTLLRNGGHRITVYLKKQQTLSLKNSPRKRTHNRNHFV